MMLDLLLLVLSFRFFSFTNFGFFGPPPDVWFTSGSGVGFDFFFFFVFFIDFD